MAPPVEVSEDEESMADSKNTSRTLGEDDSICTPSVRQNAKEDTTTALRNSADLVDDRADLKQPQGIKHASFDSLFASNRKLDNGIKLQQMHME